MTLWINNAKGLLKGPLISANLVKLWLFYKICASFYSEMIFVYRFLPLAMKQKSRRTFTSSGRKIIDSQKVL